MCGRDEKQSVDEVKYLWKGKCKAPINRRPLGPFPYLQRRMSPPQRIDTGWSESCRASANLEIASFTGPKGLSSAMQMLSRAGSTPRTRSAGSSPSVCAIGWATAFARRNCFTLLKRHRSSSHWGSGSNMNSYHECRSTLMRRDSKGRGWGSMMHKAGQGVKAGIVNGGI